MDYVYGACGKKLKTYCYPEFEDDLCAICPFNGWHREEDEEIEEEDYEVEINEGNRNNK